MVLFSDRVSDVVLEPLQEEEDFLNLLEKLVHKDLELFLDDLGSNLLAELEFVGKVEVGEFLEDRVFGEKYFEQRAEGPVETLLEGEVVRELLGAVDVFQKNGVEEQVHQISFHHFPQGVLQFGEGEREILSEFVEE